MLLNRDTAEGIANGGITLVLRRWDAPRAKPGGTQRTVAGTIRIVDVAEHPGSYRVTAAQARAAGMPAPGEPQELIALNGIVSARRASAGSARSWAVADTTRSRHAPPMACGVGKSCPATNPPNSSRSMRACWPSSRSGARSSSAMRPHRRCLNTGCAGVDAAARISAKSLVESLVGSAAFAARVIAGREVVGQCGGDLDEAAPCCRRHVAGAVDDTAGT